jgi:pimeloyl-ACP methyl ester carboxylesterase
MVAPPRTEFEVRAKDGRLLMVTVLGPEDADAVFLLHGTPGVRNLFDFNVEEGARRGLRHVLYSRPGYEGSDRHPGRVVADCAPDVAAIADELGIETFYAIGESGGGPAALAVAALLPGRVRAAATMASPRPLEADDEDWLEGQGEGNLDEYEALGKGDEAAREHIEAELDELRQVRTREQLLAALGKNLCDADRAILATEFGEGVLANWIRIGEQGSVWGWLDDDKAHLAAWGFELDRVAPPVTVWQGGKDRMVPAAHGRYLAGHLPNARLRLFPEDGHVSLWRHYDAVLADLVDRGR